MVMGASLEGSHVRDFSKDGVLLRCNSVSLFFRDELFTHTVLLWEDCSLHAFACGISKVWHLTSQIVIRTVGVEIGELGLFALKIDGAVEGTTKGHRDVLTGKRIMESRPRPHHDSLEVLMRAVDAVDRRAIRFVATSVVNVVFMGSMGSFAVIRVIMVDTEVMWVVTTVVLGQGHTCQSGKDSVLHNNCLLLIYYLV